MKWRATYFFIAALGLLIIVNAVALAGVAWNRYGSPESQLQLSERELRKEYSRDENSAIRLRLEYNWPEEKNNPYPGSITALKMAELSFKVPDKTTTNVEQAAAGYKERKKFNSQFKRKGYLVLELDGPLYQQALQLARERSAIDLAYQQDHASRLFVADSGADVAMLRARYPNRQRYAIVPAVFRPNWDDDFSGSAHIANTEIQLPLRWHALFNRPRRFTPEEEHTDVSDDVNQNSGAFTFELAFGARLEPWIANLQAQPPVP